MTHLNSRLSLDEGVKVTVPLSVTSISCPKRGTEQAVRKRAINVLTILFIYCFVSRLKVRFVHQITAGRHLLFSLMIKSQCATQRSGFASTPLKVTTTGLIKPSLSN